MADDGGNVGFEGLRPEVARALDICFDAVVAPEAWPEATQRLTEALAGTSVCFNMYGAGAQQRKLAPMSDGYRDMLGEYLSGDWAQHCLRSERGWPLIRQGRRVLLDSDVMSPEERDGAPIYNELFRRHEMEMFAALGFRTGEQLWVLNVVRPRAMGDFGAAEVEEFHKLRPHLVRLLTLAQSLAGAASAGAMAALEEADAAAIQVDWTGRVIEINAPARARLGAGLAVRAGRLVAERADGQALLDALLAAAINPDMARVGAIGGPIVLPVAAGGVLMVDAVPVRAAMADAFGRSGALLLLTDLGRRPRPSDALLRGIYGLTQREAQVAALLATGDGPAEVSDALGLKASSVRQVIKALLWKTGARRQSELVAMFARLPEGR